MPPILPLNCLNPHRPVPFGVQLAGPSNLYFMARCVAGIRGLCGGWDSDEFVHRDPDATPAPSAGEDSKKEKKLFRKALSLCRREIRKVFRL